MGHLLDTPEGLLVTTLVASGLVAALVWWAVWLGISLLAAALWRVRRVSSRRLSNDS